MPHWFSSFNTRALKLWWLLPPLAAAAVYLNTLSHEFVWDDLYLILEDHTVKSFQYLDVIFTSDFFGHQEYDLAYGYYRPLVSLSYLFDYAIWQKNPFGYHLTNILLHAAAVLLIEAVLIALRLPRKAVFLAALIFAVHPMHTENVAWISGRTDVLAFVFAAFSMWAHIASHRSRRRWILRSLAALAFLAALLSKEMAVVVVLWLGLLGDGHNLFTSSAKEVNKLCPSRIWLLPYLAMIALYLVLRFVIADVPGPYQRTDISLLQKAATAPFTVMRYLSWLIFPIHQSAYVRNPFVSGALDIRFYFGLLSLTGLLFVAILRRRQLPDVIPYFWMTLLSMLPIAGVLSASGPSDMGAVMAERFLYFPSFPFIMLMVTAALKWMETIRVPAHSRYWAAAIAAAVIIALGAKTATRNRDWKSNEIFYRRTLDAVPSPLILCNLANQYIYSRKWAEAEKALLDATRFTSDDYHYLASKALLHVAKREYKEAIVYQKRVAAKAVRARAFAYNNLAFLYRMNGDLDKAEALLKEIIDNEQGYADVYFNLAEVYRSTGRYDAARHAYGEALSRRPDSLPMSAAFAGMLMEIGAFTDAARVLETELEMHRDDAGLLNNLGVVYKKMNRPNEARDMFDRAVQAAPDYLKARLNLASILIDRARRAEALPHLQYLVHRHSESPEGKAAANLLKSFEDAAEKNPSGTAP